MKANKKKVTFNENHTDDGIHVLGAMFNNGNHPPKNRTDIVPDIKIMLIYSPKKKSANPIDEYSTLYPDTSTDSSSGKSNGCRFVSANAEMKNLLNLGKSGTAYHTCCCDLTNWLKFIVPAHKNTDTLTNPIDTS